MVKGEKRKTQILLEAEKLFYECGYENASVQDILDAIGLSKGGFYHYFKSKEQVLDEICDAKAVLLSQHASKIVGQMPENAVARLNVLFDMDGMWRQDTVEFLCLLIRVCGTGSNVMMRERMKEKRMLRLLPLLQQIIQKGCETHIFYTQYPVRLCRILLNIVGSFSDELAQYLLACGAEPPHPGEILCMLEVYRNVVERLLEAPYGSVTIYQIQNLSDISQEVWRRCVRPSL